MAKKKSYGFNACKAKKFLCQNYQKNIELGLGITISCNADNSKISPFIKLIWEQHHQLVFVTIVDMESTAVYHLQQIKKALNL